MQCFPVCSWGSEGSTSSQVKCCYGVAVAGNLEDVCDMLLVCDMTRLQVRTSYTTPYKSQNMDYLLYI